MKFLKTLCVLVVCLFASAYAPSRDSTIPFVRLMTRGDDGKFKIETSKGTFVGRKCEDNGIKGMEGKFTSSDGAVIYDGRVYQNKLIKGTYYRKGYIPCEGTFNNLESSEKSIKDTFCILDVDKFFFTFDAITKYSNGLFQNLDMVKRIGCIGHVYCPNSGTV